MEVLIKELSETEYTMHDVHALIKAVYSQRAKEGIHFQALNKTTSEIENRIQEHSGIIFVAIDKQTETLLGTGTVLFHTDKQKIPYAGLILAAVHPDAQGLGIGKLLRQRREECAKEKGCVYISSSTAENARSSIKYHLRNGAKKYGFYSSPNSDYYSIVFRKYFIKTYKGNAVYCAIRYMFSKAIVKSLFKKNGNETVVGKLLYSIKRLF